MTNGNITETERLLLREMTEADFEPLHLMNSNPKVMRYIRDGSIRTEEEDRASLSDMRAYYANNPGLGIWAMVDKKREIFVGFALLLPLDGTANIQIGYRLLEEEWGRGYATEVTQALIGYAARSLGLRRIVAIAIPENIASIRVMEKCGMRYEREFEYYGKQNALYSITIS